MKVSVIIPLFNKSAFIAETIQSVLDQTYSDFELIILDDCSTDDSFDIICTFNDPRIRIYRNDSNYGVGYSSNKLIKLSNGQYIVRIDADDICLPERLEKQVSFMENNPDIDFSSASVQCFGESNEIITVASNENEIRSLILFKTTLIQGSTIFKSDFLKNNSLFYNEAIGNVGEDWEFWVRCLSKGRALNLNEILVKYRINSGSLSFGQKDYFEKRQKALSAIFNFYQLPIEKIRVHFLFRNYFPDGVNKNVLKEFFDWSNFIIKWNSEKRYFDKNIFQAHIKKSQKALFFKVCDSSPFLGMYYMIKIKSFSLTNFRYLISRIF